MTTTSTSRARPTIVPGFGRAIAFAAVALLFLLPPLRARDRA